MKDTKRKIGSAFVENVSAADNDPHMDEHFTHVLNDLKRLEDWMKRNKIKNGWSLTEKLAFLRNVESDIRTATAMRRTQLSWFALIIAVLSATSGFVVGWVIGLL